MMFAIHSGLFSALEAQSVTVGRAARYISERVRLDYRTARMTASDGTEYLVWDDWRLGAADSQALYWLFANRAAAQSALWGAYVAHREDGTLIEPDTEEEADEWRKGAPAVQAYARGLSRELAGPDPTNTEEDPRAWQDAHEAAYAQALRGEMQSARLDGVPVLIDRRDELTLVEQ